VYAYRIRRKLNDEKGQLLQSDPSVGYRLAHVVSEPLTTSCTPIGAR
jgi:hypothetical protein